MAWTTPVTVNPGDAILSSLWNEQVRDNMLAGHPIVTASTRPASPFAGQMIYDTDTERLLVYNGSAWVQQNWVNALVGTSQSTTSVTATDLATVGPEITLTTGAAALLTVSAWITAPAGAYATVNVAVSGATTSAAAAARSVFLQAPAAGAQQATISRTFAIGGLNAGNNTFTLKYNVTSGTGTFEQRGISGVGIL